MLKERSYSAPEAALLMKFNGHSIPPMAVAPIIKEEADTELPPNVESGVPPPIGAIAPALNPPSAARSEQRPIIAPSIVGSQPIFATDPRSDSSQQLAAGPLLLPPAIGQHMAVSRLSGNTAPQWTTSTPMARSCPPLPPSMQMQSFARYCMQPSSTQRMIETGDSLQSARHAFSRYSALSSAPLSAIRHPLPRAPQSKWTPSMPKFQALTLPKIDNSEKDNDVKDKRKVKKRNLSQMRTSAKTERREQRAGAQKQRTRACVVCIGTMYEDTHVRAVQCDKCFRNIPGGVCFFWCKTCDQTFCTRHKRAKAKTTAETSALRDEYPYRTRSQANAERALK